MHSVVGQGDNKISVLVDSYRLNAYACSAGITLVTLVTLVAFVAFVALSLGDLTKVIYCIVSQSDYEVSVIIYRYRFNAYACSAGIALFTFISDDLACIMHGVIGQSNDQFSVFVNDNGFHTYSRVTCIALYICHYDSKEYIAVYGKCYFVFVCFGKQFAADVPALENKGRVKCHGCCKLCSRKELVAA